MAALSPQAQIQDAIWRGYGYGAQAIGQMATLYRPGPLAAPIAAALVVASLPAAFDPGKTATYGFKRGANYDDFIFACLIDGTATRAGDYVVHPEGVFFIASQEWTKPILSVRCNRTVTLSRSRSELTAAGGDAIGLPSQVPGQPGGGRYWGRTLSLEAAPRPGTAAGAENVVVAAGVPVNMVASAGRATGGEALPGDAPGPSRWRMHVAPSTFPDGTIAIRDYLTDEHGTRYQVATCMYTELGYRLETIEVDA